MATFFFRKIFFSPPGGGVQDRVRNSARVGILEVTTLVVTNSHVTSSLTVLSTRNNILESPLKISVDHSPRGPAAGETYVQTWVWSSYHASDSQIDPGSSTVITFRRLTDTGFSTFAIGWQLGGQLLLTFGPVCRSALAGLLIKDIKLRWTSIGWYRRSLWPKIRSPIPRSYNEAKTLNCSSLLWCVLALLAVTRWSLEPSFRMHDRTSLLKLIVCSFTVELWPDAPRCVFY